MPEPNPRGPTVEKPNPPVIGIDARGGGRESAPWAAAAAVLQRNEEWGLTMHTRFMNRAVLGAAGLLLAGAVQAALQNRDLNGDTVVDAFYDTDLDITWLRDANVNGLMNWAAATAWANNLVVGGTSGWRLPTSDPACVSYNCTDSEMGHLWYVELGNAAPGPMTNTGNFQSLQSGHYWSETVYTPSPDRAFFFYMPTGYQGTDGKLNTYYAMAVHPGDVGLVPEPETYELMLAGLIALAQATRRQRG